MKTVLFISCFFLAFRVHTACGQGSEQHNFVVVIGAFSVKENAANFVKVAKKERLKPAIEVNPVLKLNYVYVLQTDDHETAISEAKRLQAMPQFKDAWVFARTPWSPVIEKPVEIKVEEKPIEKVVVVEEVKPVVDSAKIREEQIKAGVEKAKLGTKKGEMEKLDYIFFYKDASVLRPESRFAVDNLVRLLKENPGVKIRIHGHTNGDDPGKIIRRADNKSDFFSLDNTVEDYGSAKELSEQRATTILDYLAANGIDKGRMSVKAWGGKKPIYNVDDEKAEANVRVEIEVVKTEN